MKKIKYILASSLAVILFSACSSSKVQDNMQDSVSKKITNKELLIEICKKHLGEQNYYFINELYNDNNSAITKCKMELGL